MSLNELFWIEQEGSPNEKDERLQLQNFKNIRIAFLLQTLGIVAILVYEGIDKGVRAVVVNPLFIVLMLTMAVLLWLNIKITIDVYDDSEKPRKFSPYNQIVLISVVIAIIFALVAKFALNMIVFNEIFLIGFIVFICFLIPGSYIYYVRKKRVNRK
ncbi:hypothetical protein ACA29_14685 [Lederbergia galactosidilytica]|uniref:Uncharacterized protein n=1 Tax=Lederbergia galactosidilytica TaxID=217031 RepID=A0A0Q9Y894_9BACI|nr:hypothetical protein [Lederbergia galactosidilytica]KRG11795.1 hypothetical protein ACA29_14685 [Lederbergia galactosidilytica]